MNNYSVTEIDIKDAWAKKSDFIRNHLFSLKILKEKHTKKPPNFIKFNGKKGKRTWFCCRFWRLRGLWNPSRRRGKEVPGSKDRVEF